MEHWRKQERRNRHGDDQQSGDPPAARPEPVLHANARRTEERPRGEDQRVNRRERLERHRRAEQDRVREATLLEQSIECEQGERQELEMLRLDVRQAHERLRVERRNRPTHDSGGQAARHAQGQERRRPSRQREAGEENEVVGQHRRSAKANHRDCQRALDDQRLGVGECALFRVEDAGIEEVPGIGRQRACDPRHRPRVQLRVSSIEPGIIRRRGRERPGMDDREYGENCKQRQARKAELRHRAGLCHGIVGRVV